MQPTAKHSPRNARIRPIVWPGLGSFLGRHGIRFQGLLEGTGMNPQALSNALYGRTRDPKSSTLATILAFCRTIDPTVSHEVLFGERRETKAAA